MLHEAPAVPHILTASEQATLLAIANAIMPAGQVIPAPGERTLARFEGYLSFLGATATTALRGILRTLDAASYARHLKPLAQLSPEQRLRFLEGWRTGGYVRRTALRALTLPLKVAHFDDAEFFKHVGCVFQFNTPTQIERPRWMVERVTTLEADDEIECDVVVVGTGAGGAVIARELAEHGLSVVMLEEGEYHDRRTFNGRTPEMYNKLYRNMGSTTTLGNTGIYVPVGRSVGGSTTINSGTCYRPPDRILRHWRDDLGLTEITPDHMAPYFERVEQVLGVAPAAMKHVGSIGTVIGRGCDKLGYKHRPLLRNAPECDGQGTCCFGCPTDAKRSTNVSYVPLALRAGAHLFVGARVDRVLAENGRATGVEAYAANGARLRVRARATVLSCGTFYTPVLLEKSGLAGSSGWLGRNLSLHPAQAVMGRFDEELDPFKGIPQGYAIEEFHDEGILFEGAQMPADFIASTIPYFGQRFTEVIEDLRRSAVFGFMIEDTSRGRIYSRNGRSIISYMMNDNDVAQLKRGIEILSRVFFASGAKEVVLDVHGFSTLRNEADLAQFRAAKLSARDFLVSAYHPLGTCRMGVNTSSSVVGRDNEHHDVRDLYVVDGSSVPSSLAVNPQVTIMALATRAADRLAAKLS